MRSTWTRILPLTSSSKRMSMVRAWGVGGFSDERSIADEHGRNYVSAPGQSSACCRVKDARARAPGAAPGSRPQLHVQVPDVERVVFDELPPSLDILPHERR